MRTKSIVVALSIVLAISSTISIASAAPAASTGVAKPITGETKEVEGVTTDLKGDCGQSGNHMGQGVKPNGKGPKAAKNQANSSANTPTTVNSSADSSVVIDGGFNTDDQDHGRPVVLIAAALGVPTEVFREAFSGVTPAGNDRGPTHEEAQSNKAALLKVLAPYGITNDRLDEVSNYYRYNASRGELWTSTQASATAIITNGVLTGVKITNPGSGYASNPTITVTGPNGKVTATATIAYTEDFSTNGSITAITLN